MMAKQKSILSVVLLSFGVFLFFSCSNKKVTESFSQWRGPERNGIYPEKGLLTEWPEAGLNLLWSSDQIGIGHASVAVTPDRVYATGIIDSTGVLSAFDHQGKMLWNKPYGRDWMVNFPGTRTTPLVVNDRVYLLSGHGVLYCINAETGDVVWSKDILTEYKGVNTDQGITENLLVDGEKIFCTPGGPEYNVVALNRMDGSEIWKSKGYGEKSAFCSPLLINHGGKKYVVTMTALSLLSLDAETGELAWRWGDLKYQYPDHPSTPIYSDGFLFVNDGGAGGSSKLKIAADGKSVETVWNAASLDYTLGGAVLMNNKIFAGSETKKGWVCVDWNSGNELYMTDTIPFGSVIAAEGLLYCFSNTGDFGLFNPTETEFQLKGKFNTPEGNKREHWAHPVIYNGRLYVRYGKTLWVYDIKK